MSGLVPYYITFWMHRIAVGWLAWQLTGSHAWVGIIAAAELAPMIVLGPIAGAIADRTDPVVQTRRAQLIISLQALLLAATTLSGMITPWLLLVLTLVSGIVSPLATAARQLIVPTTIPRTDYASAISIDSSFFHGSRFIGPAIAALAIPLIGVGGTLVVYVIGSLYFFLSLSWLRLDFSDRKATRSTDIAQDIADGFRYAARHAGLWPLFMMLTACSLLARPLQEMLPSFAGGVFDSGAEGLAWLTSSMGLGSLAAGIFLTARGHPRGLTHLSILACLGLALSTLGVVATSQLAYAVVFSALFGFTLTLMGVAIQAMAQIAVDDAMRGRVMILYVVIYRGLPALGALVIGILAEATGIRIVFGFCALACGIAFLVTAQRAEQITQALAVQPKNSDPFAKRSA